MVYESSYESGRKPFVPDLTRGKWASPSDFIYTCIGFAFKFDIFSIGWQMTFEMGIYAVVPYLICLVLFAVPIAVAQCFVGQFSSSGFISALRISPIFKGMGYVSLAINIAVLSYYSIFSAVPMLFLLHSFRPTLPWSCSTPEEWSHALEEEERTICEATKEAIEAKKLMETNSSSLDEVSQKDFYIIYELPSVLFFRHQFNNTNMYETDYPDLVFSPWMVFTNLLCWAITAGIAYKFLNPEKFGKLIRYGIWLQLALLTIIVARFQFLPRTYNILETYFAPEWRDVLYGLPSVPLFAISIFGSGWGSLIAFSSLNSFKSNITRQTWIICLGQLGIFLIYGFISILVHRHFTDKLSEFTTASVYVSHYWAFYLSAGSMIESMEFPNLWSIIYFLMLLIAGQIMMITQLYSILLSIFDEFEYARENRQKVTFGLIGMLALSSLYFCTNNGIFNFIALCLDCLVTQTALNFLFMIIICWIYGRVRFQRDMEFMLGVPFPNYKIHVMRYVTPLCLLCILLIYVVTAILEHLYTTLYIHIAAVFLIVLPWLFIPGYAVFMLLQASGSVKRRFARCSRPNDWYPVDPEHRQKYEETVGNTDITQQLNELGEEVL